MSTALSTAESKSKRKGSNTGLSIAFTKSLVAQYYLQGRTQNDMVEAFNVSHSTVKKYLKELREEWKEKALYDFSLAKAEQLARVDEIERVSWEGFHKSVKGSTSTTTMKSNQTNTKMRTKTKPSVSDTKWLDKIQWCVEQRSKILGLYAPKKIDQTIKNDVKLEEMSTEELLDLANKQAIEPMYEVDGVIQEVEEGVEIASKAGEIDLTNE